METKTIKLEVTIKNAIPEQIYEIFMDSRKHADLISSSAEIKREAGGKFNIYDDYITGRNIELVENEKIVQEWRGEEECWPKNHFSILTITLEKVYGGTKLMLNQEKVPAECADYFEKGWHDFYFNPLKNIFE
jgi:activator of HSP90 ATPase